MKQTSIYGLFVQKIFKIPMLNNSKITKIQILTTTHDDLLDSSAIFIFIRVNTYSCDTRVLMGNVVL